MGKLLQIRVIAQTYDEDELEKAWPRLHALAWPEDKAPTPYMPGKGVLELVQNLDEGRQFGPWSKETRAALTPGIEQAKQLKQQLENALAEWDATQANALSNQLEESLSDLEREAPLPGDS